jgi:hypothetical protein
MNAAVTWREHEQREHGGHEHERWEETVRLCRPGKPFPVNHLYARPASLACTSRISALACNCKVELCQQEIRDPLERIEAEGSGYRRTQVEFAFTS